MNEIYMGTGTLGENGRINIPIAIRRLTSMKEGSKIDFVFDKERNLVIIKPTIHTPEE